MFSTFKKALETPNAALPLEKLLSEAAGSEPYIRELSDEILRVYGRSLHIRHVDSGSCNGCDWEMSHLLNSVYDIQRFGLDFVASPRHADMIMVTGGVSEHLREALLSSYRCMGEPRLVMALGDCACGKSKYSSPYAVHRGVESILPVDIKLPGCPPRPAEIIKAILESLKRI